MSHVSLRSVKKAVEKGELKYVLVAASHSGTDPIPEVFKSPCNFLISYRIQVTGDLYRVSCHKGHQKSIMEMSGGLNLRQGARTLAHSTLLFLLPLIFFPN